MTSLKTTIVVTVLLVVGYSVYQALYDTPGSAPKQPPADDPSIVADAQRHPGADTPDQYPPRASGKQAGKRSAGSRFATGPAPDRTAANDPEPADPLARDDSKSNAPAADTPLRRNAGRDSGRLPSEGTASDRRASDRRFPVPASSNQTAPDRTVADRNAFDRAVADRAASERVGVAGAGVAGAGVASGDSRTQAEASSKSPRGRTGWNFTPDAVTARGRTELVPNSVANARDDAATADRNEPDNNSARGRPAVDRRSAASDTSPKAAPEAPLKAAAPKAAAPNEVRADFQAMMDRANRLIDEGQLANVLRDLSPWFGRANLLPEESRRVTQLLDQLAGIVIYSRQHLIEPAYVVQPNENLYQIAQRHLVPWQLLAKVNGIRDPNQLAAGRKLKVVRGPFDAAVYLERRELALTVDGCYAGRFPIGVGRDQPQLEGTYVVRKKYTQKAHEGAGGVIEPGDPRNALGRYYVELDDRIGLHGTNDPRAIGRSDGRGTVCLGDRDLEDVFDILTAESRACPGSKVTILR